MDALLEREYPGLETLYRELHAEPELSLGEKKTSERMARELKAIGLEVSSGIGGFGVVGVLRNGPAPVVLVRADMDALPVTEQTGLPYASRNGAMHACGHDVHMTCLVGAARLLNQSKEK